MALPLSRVMKINSRAIELLEEYRKELSQATLRGDLMKVGEIRASADLVMKIVSLANKPWIEKMRPMFGDDILRTLGLLDEES